MQYNNTVTPVEGSLYGAVLHETGTQESTY